MEEIQARETQEVGIERDKAVRASEGKGGEIGICPQPMGKGRRGGEGLEVSIQACWLGKKLNIRKRHEILINGPRFGVGFWVHDRFGAGGQAQKSQHGGATEGELVCPVLTPKGLG